MLRLDLAFERFQLVFLAGGLGFWYQAHALRGRGGQRSRTGFGNLCCTSKAICSSSTLTSQSRQQLSKQTAGGFFSMRLRLCGLSSVYHCHTITKHSFSHASYPSLNRITGTLVPQLERTKKNVEPLKQWRDLAWSSLFVPDKSTSLFILNAFWNKLIILCGVPCGCTLWVEYREFAKARPLHDFLKIYSPVLASTTMSNKWDKTKVLQRICMNLAHCIKHVKQALSNDKDHYLHQGVAL